MVEVLYIPFLMYAVYLIGISFRKSKKLDSIVLDWEQRYNKRIDYYFRGN